MIQRTKTTLGRTLIAGVSAVAILTVGAAIETKTDYGFGSVDAAAQQGGQGQGAGAGPLRARRLIAPVTRVTGRAVRRYGACLIAPDVSRCTSWSVDGGLADLFGVHTCSSVFAQVRGGVGAGRDRRSTDLSTGCAQTSGASSTPGPHLCPQGRLALSAPGATVL